jgi:adenine-specific DNA-methyltransferase
MEDDFLNHQFSNLFDLIIGNPPFFVIRKKEVSEEYHPFFIGRPNIFILFILKSLSLLKESGILSFVLPKNFTNCLYYQPTRDLIYDKYQIIALEKCHDKYLDTQQETIIVVLQKRRSINNQKFTLSLDGYTLFETPENIQRLKELYQSSTCLQKLGFRVSVGTVVWNQCKDILTDDITKTRLIYSSDIKDGQLICQHFNNPNKKKYIKMKGKLEPILIINRGYGVGKYNLEFCLINGDFEYLIENHLMVISYTENNLSYEQLLEKYQLVLNSLKQPQTQTFIDLYFGNNAINTSELAHILPIYKS